MARKEIPSKAALSPFPNESDLRLPALLPPETIILNGQCKKVNKHPIMNIHINTFIPVTTEYMSWEENSVIHEHTILGEHKKSSVSFEDRK